jgi:energy-converting hydrogenase A subunit M
MTVILSPQNDSQRDLLVKLAQELHIKIEVLDDVLAEKRALDKLSESSFAKEWGSEEDTYWDNIQIPLVNVPKR